VLFSSQALIGFINVVVTQNDSKLRNLSLRGVFYLAIIEVYLRSSADRPITYTKGGKTAFWMGVVDLKARGSLRDTIE